MRACDLAAERIARFKCLLCAPAATPHTFCVLGWVQVAWGAYRSLAVSGRRLEIQALGLSWSMVWLVF